MAASARFFARVLGEGGLAFTHKPCTWSEEELGHYKVDTPVDTAGYKMTAYSRYNPTPGGHGA